jgi:hypothetical protein
MNIREGGGVLFVVEVMRIIGYSMFWVVVIVGYLLTTQVAKIDLDDTLLTKVFGYNNICVFFDYPPATFVLPLVWGLCLVAMLGYVLTHHMQIRAECVMGHVSPNMYIVLTAFKTFEAFALIAFSTIFAVSPDGWNSTLYIHTAPFFLLQIGLVSMGMSNTLHGVKSGYWRRLNMPEYFESAAVTYVVVFAIVVALKIPITINALGHDLWFHRTPAHIEFAHTIDRAFLFLAAIVPMLKAVCLIALRYNQLEFVHVKIDLTKRTTKAK